MPAPPPRLAVHLRTAAIIVVGTHFGVTLASMAYASGRVGGANAALLLRDDGKGPRTEITDARHFVYLTNFVADLYAGRRLLPPSEAHVELDENVTFADPAAICIGRDEVIEAFRALRLTLHPESLRTPQCVHVRPEGASIWVTYSLYQRYLGGWLTLPSLLVVQVQLKRRTDVPQSDFLVLSMQEQWNGVPLLANNILNRMVRRGNGWLSFQLTSRILPSEKSD